MKRLLDIGFKHAGVWSLGDDALELEFVAHEHCSNVLYALVSNEEVLYIGKTVKPLKQRMYGYRKPSATQSTNLKNNANITKLLESGEEVLLYAFPDNGLLSYGGFVVNLAAGLEDSLINGIKPKWNGVGVG